MSALNACDTLTLLALAKTGDAEAVDALLRRYRPRLAIWARGRLPIWARDLADTDELVQDAMMRTLRSLQSFQPSSEAAFQHYLRNAVRNAIRDEIRKARRRPEVTEVDESLADLQTPLDVVMGRDMLRRYDEALGRLSDTDRDAIVARFEFGLTHRELAAALGKETPDAARKLVNKAVALLLCEMERSK